MQRIDRDPLLHATSQAYSTQTGSTSVSNNGLILNRQVEVEEAKGNRCCLDPLHYLPPELKNNILSPWLSPEDMWNASLVSREWLLQIIDVLLCLGKRSFDSESEGLMTFGIHLVRKNRLLLEALLNIVKASRSDERMARRAAQAMMLLNIARFNFSELDLRGIRIPNAKLHRIVLDGTNLEGSDMRGVDFSGAWMRNANLGSCYLEGIRLGRIHRVKASKLSFECFSYDGNYGVDRKGNLRDLRENRILGCLSERNTPKRLNPRVTEFHPNGKFIVAYERGSNIIKVWNTKDGKDSHLLFQHETPIIGFAFSADGKYLASCCENSLKIWNFETHQCVHVLRDEITADKLAGEWDRIALSQDGSYAALICKLRQVVHVWEVRTERCLYRWPVHSRNFSGVVFSLDDKYLVYAYDNSNVHVYEIAKGTRLQILPMKQCPDFPISSVDLFFSPSGKYILGVNSSQIYVWEIKSGNCCHVLHLEYSIIKSQLVKNGRELICFDLSDCVLSRWRFDEENGTLHLLSIRNHEFEFSGINITNAIGLSDENTAILSGAIKLYHENTDNSPRRGIKRIRDDAQES